MLYFQVKQSALPAFLTLSSVILIGSVNAGSLDLTRSKFNRFSGCKGDNQHNPQCVSTVEDCEYMPSWDNCAVI